MAIESTPISVQEQLQQLKARQFVESSMESIQQEVDDVLEIIASQLDCSEDESGTGSASEALSSAKKEAIGNAAVKLDQISAALTMAERGPVGQLVGYVRDAIKQILDGDVLPGDNQRRAIFSSFFMATRYLESIKGHYDEPLVDIPAILAPGFYQLARAGLAEFVDESSIAGINFTVSNETLSGVERATDIAGLRRLRKLYQVALIGLLQSNDLSDGKEQDTAAEQLKIFTHVAERLKESREDELIQLVSVLFVRLVEQFNSGKLKLNAQRRHFFSRYDSFLRALEKADGQALDAYLLESCLKETIYLLDIAGEREACEAQISSLGEQSPAPWSESQIELQRSLVESGLTDALGAMTTGVSAQLDEVKLRLSAMADSEICEPGDADFLEENFKEIGAIIAFCGFKRMASDVHGVLQTVQTWRDESPGQQEMLEVANQVLTLENALSSYVKTTACPGDERSQQSIQEQAMSSMADQANQLLFEELRANVGLANRAITSYMESEFNKEHIANVADCLQAAVGGLKIVGAELAADLLATCAQFVAGEYRSRLPAESGSLESLADSLISVDYLLHQLSIGQDGGPVMKQLLQQNLDAVASRVMAA